MGSILSFLPRPAATNPTVSAPSGPAEIIIFPGVRYERTDVTEEVVQSAAGRPQRRKPTPAR